MLVYFPATLPGLAALHAAGGLGKPPLIGYAVTPALREWYTSGDEEELRYAAMTEAARASLRLLAADKTAPRRRAVIVAEVEESQVRQAPELVVTGPVGPPEGRGLVQVGAAVSLADVPAVYADDAVAEADVAAAAEAVHAADDGDDDAEFLVGTAEDHELLWYATQEIPSLTEADPVD